MFLSARGKFYYIICTFITQSNKVNVIEPERLVLKHEIDPIFDFEWVLIRSNTLYNKMKIIFFILREKTLWYPGTFKVVYLNVEQQKSVKLNRSREINGFRYKISD